MLFPPPPPLGWGFPFELGFHLTRRASYLTWAAPGQMASLRTPVSMSSHCTSPIRHIALRHIRHSDRLCFTAPKNKINGPDGQMGGQRWELGCVATRSPAEGSKTGNYTLLPVRRGSFLTYHSRSWTGSNKCRFDSARPQPVANCRSPPLAFLAPSNMAFTISLLIVSKSRVRHL
jgi:hypothetical protein